MSLSQIRPAGAPRCLGCRRRQVKRKVTRTPCALGDRIVGGVRYCWYCSRRCACRQQGLRSAREGRTTIYAGPIRAARLKAAEAARHVLYAEDVKTLHRYGVPASLTLAILDRTYLHGHTCGYNRAYYRLSRKAVA